MAEEDDKYYVGPMNEGQAQTWFQLGGDTLDKLEPREISNLQLAMERNPEAFTDAQRSQVKDVAWKMIDNVAKGKHKLDPRETNNFKSILDHVPATTMMEGGDKLQTFKDAEQKWYNADRGIEEKSFGERVSEQAKAAQQQVKEGVVNAAQQVRDGAVNTANRVKEGASAVKQHVSEKAKALADKGKAVNRLRRMQYNRDKAAVKQMFSAGKAKAIEFKNKAAQKVKQGAKTAAEVPFVLAFGVKELAVMGYNAAKNKINQGVNKVKTGFNNQVNKVKNKVKNGVNKVKNGVNKVKNFGKKVWNGTKKAALVAGYIVASPVILPYKAAKWVGKKIKNGVNWVRNGYNKLKAKAFGGPTEVADNAKTAEKQARGNQNKLSAEQVMANWKQIGRGESDGRYNMSKHSESLLNAVMKGEMKIDKANAPKIAAWLEVNRDIQDRVNKNNVTDKNERNQNIAAQLEQYGIKNPYKTEETQTQEAQSQTPPVQEQPKEQEQPAPQPTAEKPQAKEVPLLNPEQEKLVQSQLGILKELSEKDGLRPNDETYRGLVGMMEKGFAEKGITPEQMGAIREFNKDLFPAKEDAEKPSADRVAMNKAAEKVKETFAPRDKSEPNVVKVKPLSEEQAAFVENNAKALKQLTENNKSPEAHEQYLNLMNESFKQQGMTAEQIMAANQAYGMNPEGKQPGIKYEFDQPAPAAGNGGKPQEKTAETPNKDNPESFNLSGVNGNEGVSGDDMGTGEPSKANEAGNKKRSQRTPEQKAQRRAAQKVLQAQGLRLKPAAKPVKATELNPKTLTLFNGKSNANSA